MRRFFRRSPPQQRVTPERAPGSPKASRLNKSEDFESHSIKQLKKLCAERGIDHSKFVEKDNFIEALRDDDNNRQHAGGLAKAIRRGTDVRDEDVPLPRTYSDFAKSRATGVPLQSPPRKVPPSRELTGGLEDGKVFMAVGFDRQTGAIDVAPLRVCRIDANGDPGEDDLARQLNEALTRGRGSFKENRRKDAEQKRLDRMYGNGSPGASVPLQTQSADRGLNRKRLERNRRQTTGSSRPGTAALDSGRPIRKINLDGKNLPRQDSFSLERKNSFSRKLSRQDSTSSIDFSAVSPKMSRLDSSSSLDTTPMFSNRPPDGFWPAGDDDFLSAEIEEERARKAKKKFYAKGSTEAGERGRYEKRDRVEAERREREERAEARARAAKRREAERAQDRARAAMAERRPPPPELGEPPSDIPLQYRTPEKSRPLPANPHPSQERKGLVSTPPMKTAGVCLPEDRRFDLDGLAKKAGPISYHDVKWLETDLGWRSLGTQRGAPAERRRKLCERELQRWEPVAFESKFGARVQAGPDAKRIAEKVAAIFSFLEGLLAEVPVRPLGRPPSPRYEEPFLKRAQGVDVRR